jgi:hypothetical protein
MPSKGSGRGWSAGSAVHALKKKKIPANIAKLRSQDSTSKCAYASAFQEGDVVKILKEGSHQGKLVTITDAHWAGRVKVELGGVEKSYLAKELEPPADRTSWNSVLHTVKNTSVQSRSAHRQLKGNRWAEAAQARSNRSGKERLPAARNSSSSSSNDIVLEHYAQQLCALSAHHPDSSPAGVLRAAAERFLMHATTGAATSVGGLATTSVIAKEVSKATTSKMRRASLSVLGAAKLCNTMSEARRIDENTPKNNRPSTRHGVLKSLASQAEQEPTEARPTREGATEGRKEESTAAESLQEEPGDVSGDDSDAQVIDILDERHARQAEELFELLDLDEDGKIEINQAVTFINSCHGEGKQGPEAEQAIVKTYDQDHDGRLNLEEFKRIFSDIVTGKHEENEKTPQAQKRLLMSVVRLSVGPLVHDVEEMGHRGCTMGCTAVSAFSGMCRVVTHTEIVHPESPTAFWTNLITAGLLVYSAFLIPARLGFNSETEAGFVTHSLDYVCEVWFLLDVFINFHLGYVDQDTGDTIMDPHRIRKQYLRSWFVVDMFSSLPTKFLTLAVSSLAQLSWIKCARILKMFRLVKLLNLKALHDLEDSGYVRPSAVRFCKISFAFVFAVHLSSCTYWAYVRWTCSVCDDSNSASISSDCPAAAAAGPGHVAWTTPSFCPPMFRVASNGFEPSLIDSYLVAFYWSIMVMLGK